MILYDYEIDWCGSYGTHVVNWSGGLPTGFALIHGRGMAWHKSKRQKANARLRI